MILVRQARDKMRNITKATILAAVTATVIAITGTTARAADIQPLSISLEGYDYPYPIRFFPVLVDGQDLRMAYMDVTPSGKGNGRTVLLFHGKNFPGAYWRETIDFLVKQGYRVIVPDQIGFGKSSKPDIHYSFHLLAAQTKQLLNSLWIKEVTVVGHSMGGMLATRFTLLYPETARRLVLENPIGLEDYRLFVPYASIENLYRGELNATPDSIRNYHKSYYGQWRPEHGEYAELAVRQLLSGEYHRLARASALTSEMIYEQPVCHEFGEVKSKTLLIIGQADRTVAGKARVPKELLARVGQYPELGRKTAALIPGARLVELAGVGHIPHLEAPETFQKELLRFLEE